MLDKKSDRQQMLVVVQWGSHPAESGVTLLPWDGSNDDKVSVLDAYVMDQWGYHFDDVDLLDTPVERVDRYFEWMSDEEYVIESELLRPATN